MTIFKDSHIVADFGFLSFKKKLEVKNKIINNGGILSYVLTKTSKYLVLCDLDKIESSYKCRMALKIGIPVVSPEFLDACIHAGYMIDVGPYLLGQQNKMESFKHGKIAANLEVMSQKKKAKQMGTLQNIKIWASDDIDAPRFPENYHIAKWAVLTKSVKSKVEQILFQVLELHALEEEIRNSVEFPYRIFIHNGVFTSHSGVTNDTQEYCYIDSVEKALLAFLQFYKKKTSPPLSFIRTMNLNRFPDKNFGSKNFYKIINDNNPLKIHPGDNVLELAVHIWQEAVGHVENLLPLGIEDLDPNKIVQAESTLLQIKRAIINNVSKEEVAELSEEFRKALNLSKENFVPITSKKQLIQNQDFCQLLKDIWSVNESTNWKCLGARTKYSSLQCDISCLEKNSLEYRDIENMIFSSENWNSAFQIHNVFRVERFIEDDNFVHEMNNKKLLFHGSTPQNLLGILFRGLLLPNILTEVFGGDRSDEGMLGNGIYFSDSPSYSLKFAPASQIKGTQFVFLHEVALGNCQDAYHTNFSLSQPPEGFDSIHGVKQKPDCYTDFTDDEYVIYKLNQQRMKYLVEFSKLDDSIQKVKFSLSEPQEEILESHTDNKTIDVNDVKGVSDPLKSTKVGLITSSDICLPLKSVHIKATLIDLVAKVIIFQAYTNDSHSAIEAKYVFPLSDLATVVGFEAFINNKHIVGKVKEKEIAHREYKEAIDRGHGAYLMDQEAADVFTVSVGNLPPKASVLIKITYLEELSVEGECILFSLPGSMAPWKKDLAFSQVTQSSVPTIGMIDHSPEETTIEVAMEMPYIIKTISSPSHLIKIKRTDTFAMVETAKDSKLAEGFQLLIGLAEIHVPRMWVGNVDGDQREACMLTFYPEFVVNESSQVEIILLLDMSNSMKPNEVDVKKMALLILDFLPDNCLFNIITFGQGYQELFPSSQKPLPRNIEAAAMFIQNAIPQMGSTQLLKPLKSFYLLSSKNSDLKNLFVISDGHFNDHHLILQSTKKCNSVVRVFSLGVGSTANKHVLRGLAKAGAGSFEFFDNKMKSKWEAKIKSLLSKTTQPVLTDVRVEWQQFNENAPHPIQAPKVISSLFNGSRLVVYGFTSDCHLATLKAVIDGCEVSTIVSTPQLNIQEGMMLHQLTTKALIQDWEDGILHAEPAEHELLKKTNESFIIELSKKYSVVSSLTSFVAVEERSEDEEMSSDEVDFELLIGQESSHLLDYLPWEGELMTFSDSDQQALSDYDDEVAYCDEADEDFALGMSSFEELSLSNNISEAMSPTRSYRKSAPCSGQEMHLDMDDLLEEEAMSPERSYRKSAPCSGQEMHLDMDDLLEEETESEVLNVTRMKARGGVRRADNDEIVTRMYAPPAVKRFASPRPSKKLSTPGRTVDETESEVLNVTRMKARGGVRRADNDEIVTGMYAAPSVKRFASPRPLKKLSTPGRTVDILDSMVVEDVQFLSREEESGDVCFNSPHLSYLKKIVYSEEPSKDVSVDLPQPNSLPSPQSFEEYSVGKKKKKKTAKAPDYDLLPLSRAEPGKQNDRSNVSNSSQTYASTLVDSINAGRPIVYSSPSLSDNLYQPEARAPLDLTVKLGSFGGLHGPSRFGFYDKSALNASQALSGGVSHVTAESPSHFSCPAASIKPGAPPAVNNNKVHTFSLSKPSSQTEFKRHSRPPVLFGSFAELPLFTKPLSDIVLNSPEDSLMQHPESYCIDLEIYDSCVIAERDYQLKSGICRGIISPDRDWPDSTSADRDCTDSTSADTSDTESETEPKPSEEDFKIFQSYIKNEPVSFLEPKREPVAKRLIRIPDTKIDIFKYQNMLGFWEFGSEVDQYLGISHDQCMQQLYEAGLKSFGPDIEQDIQRLIVTMMVLLSFEINRKYSDDVVVFLKKTVIYQRPPFSIQESDFSNFFKLRFDDLEEMSPMEQQIKLAVEYIFNAANKCSWVCNALHLGNNWWNALYQLRDPIRLESPFSDSDGEDDDVDDLEDYWMKER